jgi:rhamnulose-1-phosphate aldolase
VGRSLDAAFGLIDTVEKAAAIYLKAMQAGGIRHRLTTAQLEALAARFNIRPDPLILYA